MDWQSLFNFATGALGVVLGWIVRTLWTAGERLRTDLQELERGIPNTYVRRDDFREAFQRVEEALMRIEDKLDRKADR